MVSKNKIILTALLALISTNISAAAPAAQPTRLFNDFDERCLGGECSETSRQDLLYAKKLKAKHIDACKINSQQLCAECIKSKLISTEKLNVRCEACIKNLKADKLHVDCEACIKKLKADKLHVECEACIKKLQVDKLKADHAHIRKLNADKICGGLLNAPDLCITGTASLNEVCQKYKATLVFDTNTSYSLSTPVNWNTILSDPNNNVSMSPTRYTAPVSGEYIVAIELNQKGLTGPTVIVGTPVANIQILVNGVVKRETFVPFLSFHAAENAVVDSLLHLNKGEVVTTIFNVLVMTDAGFSAYPGATVILGNGTEEFATWKIHYLSSDCAGVTCVPCQRPCEEPCEPCDPKPCKPKPCYPKPDCQPCERESWDSDFSWLH